MKASLTARISNLTQSFSTGKQVLSLELDEDFREYIDSFNGKELTVEIKPKVKRRTRDANAFLWATLGDIAGVVGIPPVEIYRKLIPDVGDNYEVVPVKTSKVERWKAAWEEHGLGWVCEELPRPCKIEGYTNLMCYLGSSRYDRQQMSRLIELALQEAREQGIPPRMTRAEIQATIERWGEAAMDG